MKRLTVVLLTALLTLVSCAPEARLHGLASGQLTIVSIIEDRRMAVLLFDDAGAALSESMAVTGFADDDLDDLVTTLTDLAIATGRMGAGTVDGQLLLDVLREGASSLRKTRLTDTLAKVSGGRDDLAELARLRSAELFDLRGRIDAAAITQAWLTRYIEEVRRYLRRR